jgi:hypothetical protein
MQATLALSPCITNSDDRRLVAFAELYSRRLLALQTRTIEGSSRSPNFIRVVLLQPKVERSRVVPFAEFVARVELGTCRVADMRRRYGRPRFAQYTLRIERSPNAKDSAKAS